MAMILKTYGLIPSCSMHNNWFKSFAPLTGTAKARPLTKRYIHYVSHFKTNKDQHEVLSHINSSIRGLLLLPKEQLIYA